LKPESSAPEGIVDKEELEKDEGFEGSGGIEGATL
jgi:hypothetical protein